MRPLLRPTAALACVLLAAAPAGAGERTRAALREALPKFDPAQAAAATGTDATKVARPVAEDGVTILPDFNVVEKKVAEPEPDQWLTGEAVAAREARRLEADMNGLELALNRWHIPLLSASFAQRARAGYEAKKFREQVGNYFELARKLEKTDPKAAKKIRESLDFRKLPKDDKE